ncbi:capping complex subunit for YIEGIA [Halanaerobaculum tunisiense]
MDITDFILAIVTTKEEQDKVESGSAPIFYAADEEELEYIAMLISRLTKSMVHDLGNGVYILIKH